MAHPLFDLSGRTAVVVGGTSGIGRTVAIGLAEGGADVVVSARRQELVDEIAAEIERLGRRTLRVTSDVGDAESLARLRDQVLGAFGRVDIVVSAAGITKRVPTLEMDEADWQKILIGIASISSFIGLYEVAAYGASKSALAGLTRGLAVEWAKHGVTVNAIAPGVFRTDLNAKLLEGPRGQEFLLRTPMGRFGRVEELVGAAIYLASDAGAFVTGQLIVVDGGLLASGVNQ
jgi:NAD(P)-dependent dehydrogenase (short-subunit alcohol dehydrogenase family)